MHTEDTRVGTWSTDPLPGCFFSLVEGWIIRRAFRSISLEIVIRLKICCCVSHNFVSTFCIASYDFLRAASLSRHLLGLRFGIPPGRESMKQR
jgi:hypothetical protein